MNDPFSGVLAWIWNLENCEGGDVNAIVQRLLSNGCAGAIIKDTDAGHTFGDWTQVRALITALRAAGLSALTWGYLYDADAAGERAIQIDAIKTNEPDGRVFDAEAEFELAANKVADATALATAVTAACPGVPLAYAPIGSIRNHLSFPWLQFTSAGLRMLPQTYYRAFGWTPTVTLDAFYADIAQYNLGAQPIYPAYIDAPSAGQGSTTADVITFATLAKAAGATGISVWSYEHLDAAGWQRVATAAQLFPHLGPPTPPPPTKPPLDDKARLQGCAYLAGGSGVQDMIAWLQGFA